MKGHVEWQRPIMKLRGIDFFIGLMCSKTFYSINVNDFMEKYVFLSELFQSKTTDCHLTTSVLCTKNDALRVSIKKGLFYFICYGIHASRIQWPKIRILIRRKGKNFSISICFSEFLMWPS